MRIFSTRKSIKWQKMTDAAVVFILNCPDEGMKDLSAEDVAAMVGLDKSSLTKAFRRTLRISLTGFIKREILYRALFALETESHIEVGDLAKRLGFGAGEAFAREFEDFFLITPQKYKELVTIRKQTRGCPPDHICAPL